MFTENSELDFIRAIQPAKKAQLEWAQQSYEHRVEIVRKWTESLKQISAHLSSPHVDSLQFFTSQQIEKFELAPLWVVIDKLLSTNAELNVQPVGLFSLISPNLFAFRFVVEKIAPCLLAGNGVFVKVSRKNKIAAEILQKSLQDSAFPLGLIHVFCGDESLAELLVTHPVIQAVIFSGKSTTAEMVVSKAVASWKRLQVHSAYHNSALLMRELSEDDIRQLVTACLLAGGRLPWSINNILLLESHLENFKKSFLPAIEAWGKVSFPISELQRLQDLQKLLQQEKTKPLLPMILEIDQDQVLVSPAVIQDLTHCSTLYQDCLGAPVIFLSPVKYVHEMVRWTNNSYYGQCALLFASAEQVQKFAPRLEVAQIFANQWLPTEAGWVPGWKQSFYGIADQQIFGSFYSQRQCVDAGK